MIQNQLDHWGRWIPLALGIMLEVKGKLSKVSVTVICKQNLIKCLNNDWLTWYNILIFCKRNSFSTPYYSFEILRKFSFLWNVLWGQLKTCVCVDSNLIVYVSVFISMPLFTDHNKRFHLTSYFKQMKLCLSMNLHNLF